MEDNSQTDDPVVTLVEKALARPDEDREIFLRETCGANRPLFDRAWSSVQLEKRMQGFLVDRRQPALDSKPPFQPGQIVINRFRIVREVAQGGMGIVWEAMDQKLDRRVALKCAKAGFGKQLPPEVRNAREISHPNVCKIFEIHTASTVDGEIDFISMEFLDGSTLAERLEGALPSKAEAAAIARQLCAGLAEAHRGQLIHGDLKPNNVILAKNGDGTIRAVITDFGLARPADASAFLLAGTPVYMAPELWRGAKPSIASDIYALGILLWELRHGSHPRASSAQSSTLPAGVPSVWKPPLGRGRWDRVVWRCLEEEPSRRFSNVNEIAEKLGPSQMLRRFFAAAAAVALVAGSGLITYQRTAPPVEQVELALLPMDAAVDGGDQGLLRTTESRLAELKSTPHTHLRFISLDNVIRHQVRTPDEARALLGATHAMRASLEKLAGGGVRVHGYLTDLRSGVDIRQWAENYKADELRYAPAALAGLVTNALHLPPPTAGGSVNKAALPDLDEGLADMRRDSTLERAMAHLERASAADADSALPLAAMAEAQWLQQAITNDTAWFDRASELMRQARLRNPDLAPVHRAAGLLKTREGRYEQAVGDYLRAIELEPANADAYRYLAETYMNYDQGEEALAALHKAIELDPAQYRSYRYLGNFFVQRGRYKEAITQFRNALNIAPGETLVKRELGFAYMEDGQFALAEGELRAFLATKEAASALDTLGVVLMYESREREAIPIFLRALHLGAERPEWWMNLGTCYRRIGLASDARAAFRRGIDLAERKLIANPRDGLLRSVLSYLCAQIGDRQRAQAEIAQALQSSPNDADVRGMAAITYEALGQREATLAVLANCPAAVLADLSRWPDAGELRKDVRFQQMLSPAGR